MRSWYDQQQNCTSGSTPTPDHHGERRIAVVVSGLGTTSGGNSAWEIDTGTLGYAVDDVVRFSYAGGRAPRADEPPGWSGRGARNDVEFARALDPGLEDIPDSLFDESDSQQSIDVSADRLGELLRQVAVAEPDVPIDVLSHSQGGVVARLGVVEAGADGNLPATVENLVTIGSPHQGAPMATAIEAIQASPAGRVGLGEVRDSGVAEGLDDRLPAITQLSETSAVLDHMRSLPIPEGVRFTALGGSGDLTVPAPVTGDPQADVHHVIPTPTGTDAHGDLASLPATTREIALATAGMGPSCQSWRQALGIAMQSDTIRSTEAMVGAAGLVATTTAAVPNVVAAVVED